jgi:hypothetical protein
VRTRASGWSRLAATALSAAALGCNGSPAAPPTPAEAGAICPATVEATIGARCAVVGLRCGPQYTCGLLQPTLLCVCDGASFHCTDSVGNEVDTSPTCPGPVATQSCPANGAGVQNLACKEQGLLCPYPSSCAGQYDQCQCSPGALVDGGFGLRFDCQRGTCRDAGPAIIFDSSVGDTGGGREASADGTVASSESGTAADSSATDATTPADSPGDGPTAGEAGDAPGD